MAKNLKIEINIIHSPPDTNPEEFFGVITKSRNEAIGSIMNEFFSIVKDIPHDHICSVVLGSKNVLKEK